MANIDLIKRHVIICAGHGGGDPGAIGQGTTEAAETIDITNRVVDYLRRDGQLQVTHVPNELSFEQSISWINARFGHIDDGVALDIHKNSAGVAAQGGETWYPDDPDSHQIALLIQSGVRTALKDRGVKPDTLNRWGRLGFCRDVNTWATLVEAGFISAGGDAVGGDANQRYAEAIGKGLLAVFGLVPKPVYVPPAPAPTKPVTWLYKVVSTADGKQLGVYNVKVNAWLKYQAVHGAAKIVDPAGTDLTREFVLAFGVKEPVPPTYAPKEDVDALKARVSAIDAFIELIKKWFPFIK